MTAALLNGVPLGALSYASQDARAAQRICEALRAAGIEVWPDAALALARQIGSDRSAADAALKTLIDKDAGDSAYQIAEIYALRNDAKETFAWLDRTWSNRDAGIQLLLYDPFILRFKGDPRFAVFCRKVGLPVPGKTPTMMDWTHDVRSVRNSIA